MKTESKKPTSEIRKIRKPLMEKKRRARINDSLEMLKQILLDSQVNVGDNSAKKRRNQRSAKLEKADILEMTVNYIQNLQLRVEEARNVCGKNNNNLDAAIRGDYDSGVGVTLVPTRLGNGELAFVLPGNHPNNCTKKQDDDNMWRPW